MNRHDAISLIKEITLEKCTTLTGHDIILKQKNPQSIDDYELEIKTKLDHKSYSCLEAIVWHNDYGIRKEFSEGSIIIFDQVENERNQSETGLA